MSGHNWKPGDVALVTIPGRGETVAMYMDGGDWETPWAESDGQTTYAAAPTYGNGLPGRPLVVIDPEDREQVKRLDDLLWATNTAGEATNDLQAALREFATPTPPKPDEPQGLGAVVEDANGAKWVRAGHSYTDPNWRRAGGDDWTPFDQISAVRVLSEGVVL